MSQNVEILLAGTGQKVNRQIKLLKQYNSNPRPDVNSNEYNSTQNEPEDVSILSTNKNQAKSR